MKFEKLHDTIPLARYGKAKSLTMEPYAGVTLAMPGRHAEDTTPKGGDFVVMVTDAASGWDRHQFKHDDIFNDIELKSSKPVECDTFMRNYLEVIALGTDPARLKNPELPGVNPKILLEAIQCLAVAEHRRYAMYEHTFGGRFLPFRFAAGIAEGLWTADEAIKVQKYGRPAVERLEKNSGKPLLTQKLIP